jgi:hypothetical protein
LTSQNDYDVVQQTGAMNFHWVQSKTIDQQC